MTPKPCLDTDRFYLVLGFRRRIMSCQTCLRYCARLKERDFYWLILELDTVKNVKILWNKKGLELKQQGRSQAAQKVSNVCHVYGWHMALIRPEKTLITPAGNLVVTIVDGSLF